MTATPVLSLDGVTRRYGTRDVLHVPRLDFRDAERVAIAGANGSGKSTLLRVIAGVSRPTTGSRRLAASLETQAPGYVPQAGGVYGDLTVRSNLTLRRRLRGVTDTAREQQIVEQLQLGGMLDRRVSDLSVGYRRMVALACALCGSPTWLVLDEPFAGVDEDNRGRLQRLLDDMPLRLLIVAELAGTSGVGFDRIVGLREGRLI